LQREEQTVAAIFLAENFVLRGAGPAVGGDQCFDGDAGVEAE